MFDKNKKEDLKEIELIEDPDKINLDSVSYSAQSQENSNQINLNRLKARVISRYTHQKKTIVFFMYTCRRLRNLAKYRNLFKYLSNNLMYAAILLLKKGMIMNEAAVASLKKGVNIYGIEGFE